MLETPIAEKSSEPAKDAGHIVASLSPPLVPSGRFRVREYLPTDAATICSWVQDSETLKIISGNDAESLSPEILAEWNTTAVISLVAFEVSTSKPVGYCTLSSADNPQLPPLHIELCHLIVAPTTRHISVGSQLCDTAESVGIERGFIAGCARVLPTNLFALKLAMLKCGEEITGKEAWATPGFRWFRKIPRQQNPAANTNQQLPQHDN